MTALRSTVMRHNRDTAQAPKVFYSVPDPQQEPVKVVVLRSVDGAPDRTVPVTQLLRTRALPANCGTLPGPLSARLCEHFEGHGSCNRGIKCRFAHHVSNLIHHPPSTAAAATSALAPTTTEEVSPSSACSTTSDAAAHRDARIVVVFGGGRGWRHAAYDAKPRTLTHPGRATNCS